MREASDLSILSFGILRVCFELDWKSSNEAVIKLIIEGRATAKYK